MGPIAQKRHNYPRLQRDGITSGDQQLCCSLSLSELAPKKGSLQLVPLSKFLGSASLVAVAERFTNILSPLQALIQVNTAEGLTA